jgi:hypothetical protein
MLPHVPAHAERHLGAGGEVQKGLYVGGRLDRDPVALARGIRRDDPLREADARHGKDALHGPDQIDEGGKVVRPHVEDRAAARLEEELRVGMPVLHPVRHQERRSRQDPSDGAVIDELASQTPAPAEKGVRGAAEEKAAGLRLLDQDAAFLEIDREGLFGEDVLAGAERRQRHAEMGAGDRQVDDEVDVLARQEFVDRHSLDVEAARLCLRGLGPRIRTGPQGEPAIGRDVLEVDGRDVAAADHANVKGVHGLKPSRLDGCRGWRAIRSPPTGPEPPRRTGGVSSRRP